MMFLGGSLFFLAVIVPSFACRRAKCSQLPDMGSLCPVFWGAFDFRQKEAVHDLHAVPVNGLHGFCHAAGRILLLAAFQKAVLVRRLKPP